MVPLLLIPNTGVYSVFQSTSRFPLPLVRAAFKASSGRKWQPLGASHWEPARLPPHNSLSPFSFMAGLTDLRQRIPLVGKASPSEVLFDDPGALVEHSLLHSSHY